MSVNRAPRCARHSFRGRLLALVEIAAFEACFFISAWLLQAARPGGYGWYSKALMIMLGLLGILTHRRPREYGLKPRSLRFSLRWSAYVAAPFAIAFFAMLSLALAADLPLPEPVKLAKDLLWYFVFVGFAEELFFRGYTQSRLNEVFTKKYEKFLWIEYEWTQGTLVTTIIFFGFPHLLTGINPFIGRYSIDPFTMFITVSAVFMGLVFGVIREKTECVLVPTVLHGSMDFTALAPSRAIGLVTSNIAAAIALFTFFAILFEKLLKEPI